MTNIIQIPFHIGDFLSSTMHMDATEVGAHWMLIIAHYQAGEKGLPNDDKKLAMIAKVTTKTWARIRDTVLEKFDLKDDFWSQKRVIETLLKVSEVKAQNSAKSLKRWSGYNAVALHQISKPKTLNHKPIKKDIPNGISKTIAPKRIEKPPDIDQNVWEDFEKHRQAKKAPVTETVINMIRHEAVKAGWTLEAAIKEMCSRGWQGFKAEWIENERKNNGSPQKTVAQRADEATARALAKLGSGEANSDFSNGKAILRHSGHLQQATGGAGEFDSSNGAASLPLYPRGYSSGLLQMDAQSDENTNARSDCSNHR